MVYIESTHKCLSEASLIRHSMYTWLLVFRLLSDSLHGYFNKVTVPQHHHADGQIIGSLITVYKYVTVGWFHDSYVLPTFT